MWHPQRTLIGKTMRVDLNTIPTPGPWARSANRRWVADITNLRKGPQRARSPVIIYLPLLLRSISLGTGEMVIAINSKWENLWFSQKALKEKEIGHEDVALYQKPWRICCTHVGSLYVDQHEEDLYCSSYMLLVLMSAQSYVPTADLTSLQMSRLNGDEEQGGSHPDLNFPIGSWSTSVWAWFLHRHQRLGSPWSHYHEASPYSVQRFILAVIHSP